MADIVIAEAILRSKDGSSILDATGPITSENISKYRVEKERIDEISNKLAELGFTVRSFGSTSITISGEKDIFERVFHTKLAPRTKDIMGTKVEGVQETYYEIAEPIQVPEELSSFIADIVLSTPPEFFP
jgi:hypothetical protein